jgi:hypothetical protein
VSALSASRRGQQAAEAIMTDRCLITRLAAKGNLNPASGKFDRPETEIYLGPCRVKAEAGTSVGDTGVGEAAVSRVTPIVSIPISAGDIKAGDRVLVMSSTDLDLTEQKLMVRSVNVGSFLTARRLICEVL